MEAVMIRSYMCHTYFGHDRTNSGYRISLVKERHLYMLNSAHSIRSLALNANQHSICKMSKIKTTSVKE